MSILEHHQFKGLKEVLMLTVFVLMGLGFLIFLYWFISSILASRGIFWTLVSEGTAQIVTTGKAIHRIIVQKRGYRLRGTRTLDAENNPVLYSEYDLVVDNMTLEPSRFGGFRWVGVYPIRKVWSYGIEWIEFDADGKPRIRKDKFKYVSLKDHTYLLPVVEAEDIGEMPVNLTLAVILRVVNPYKAVFVATNWIQKALDVIDTATRNVVTQKHLSAWQSEDEDMSIAIHNRITAGVVHEGVLTRLEDIESVWGVRVVSLQVKKIDPTPEQRAATVAKRRAELEGEALLVTATAQGNARTITATAEGKAIKITAKAEAGAVKTMADAESLKIAILAQAEVNRIQLVYEKTQSFGDFGQLMVLVEKLAEGPGMATIHMIPGLTEFLSGFKGRNGGNVTKAEFDELNERIKELITTLHQE